MKWPNGSKCWTVRYCNKVGGWSVRWKKRVNKCIERGTAPGAVATGREGRKAHGWNKASEIVYPEVVDVM